MPANPNCARTYASLCLSGDNLIPEDITHLFKAYPCFAVKKGEPVSTKANAHIAETGRWILSTEKIMPQNTDLEEHVNWLLDQIDTAEKRQIVSKYGGNIFCFWLSASGHGGPGFSPKTLGRLNRLRLNLWFDFYRG